MVFLPIIFSVARKFGGSVLMYALPTAGAFAAMHAIVPPHPGPVTAVTVLEGSVGLTLLLGLPVALIAWYVGVYLVTTAYAGKIMVPIRDMMSGGSGADETDDESDGSGGGTTTRTRTQAPPTFGAVLSILLLPLVLIALNTTLTTLRATGSVAEDGLFVDLLILLGQTPVALLITLLVATYTLGMRGRTLGEIESLLNDSLAPICAIVLITGAGGMFGGVLRQSGIGAPWRQAWPISVCRWSSQPSSSPPSCGSRKARPPSHSRPQPVSSRLPLSRLPLSRLTCPTCRWSH